MSRSLLQQLVAEVRDLLAALRDALDDPDARRATYGEVGIDPSVPPPPTATWENLNQLDRYTGEVDPDLAGYREAADAAIAVTRSIREHLDAVTAGDAAQVQAWLRALIALWTLSYVKNRHAVLYAVARLVGVIEEKFTVHFTEQVSYERIEAVFTEEFWCHLVDVSSREQPDDDEDRFLDSEADAQRLSDLTLLPAAVALHFIDVLKLTERQVVLYGWDPLPRSPTPEADRIAGRTLSVSATIESTAADTEDSADAVRVPVVLTLMWMPRDHGGPALLASLDAAPISSTIDGGDAGDIRVSVDLGGTDRATMLVPLVADAAGDMLAGFGVTERAYEITIERISAPEGPWVLGDPDGLRLEVGLFAASIGYRVTGHGLSSDASLTLRLVARDSLLVLATDEADPVVSRTLDSAPREALQVPFDLGLVLEMRSDGTFVRLEGGTGLRAVIPVGRGKRPVRVHHVAVSFGGAEADGRAQLVLEATVALTVDLGWLTLSLEGLGLAWDLREPREIGFRAPAGIGLEVALGTVTGSGFLLLDPEQELYAAVLSLEVKGLWFIESSFSVAAVAILGVRDGRRSLLVLLGLEWEPWPVGFGFTLNGVGGLLAENRTVATDALRSGLRGHNLDAVLFPQDPAANAPALVAALDGLFPVAAGQRVIGLMVRFGYGVPNFLVADIAVLYEEPAPRRVILLGRLVAVWEVDDRFLVHLRLDVVGTWHTDRSDVALDGTLHGSRIAGFPVDGDGAWRSRGGDDPVFLLSVGGYHPDFEPPSNFPQLRRVSFDLLTGDNPRVRFEAYFALTSNTVQAGGCVELFYAKAGFSLEGRLALDVLLDRQTCSFTLGIDFLIALKRGRTVIAALHFAGRVSGTSPWCVTGSATLEFFFFSISFPIDVTAGEDAPPPELVPARVEERLAQALADHRNWQSELPADGRSVTTLREPADEDIVYLHPMGAVAVSQTVVPLDVTIDHLDAAPLESPRRFHIHEVIIGGATVDVTSVHDHFAPAQFFALSDHERLVRPSFEQLPSGVRAVVGGTSHGTPVTAALGYETVVVDSAGHRRVEDVRALSAAAMVEASRAARCAQPFRGQARLDSPGAQVRVEPPRFRVVSSDDLGPSGVPELDRPASFTEQREALAQHLHDHPDDRRRLQLVGAHERVPR